MRRPGRIALLRAGGSEAKAVVDWASPKRSGADECEKLEEHSPLYDVIRVDV